MDTSSRQPEKPQLKLADCDANCLVELLRQMLASIKPQLKYLPGLIEIGRLEEYERSVGVEYPSGFSPRSRRPYSKIRVLQFMHSVGDDSRLAYKIYLSDRAEIFQLRQLYPNDWGVIAVTLLDDEALATLLVDLAVREDFYNGLTAMVRRVSDKRRRLERQFQSRLVAKVSEQMLDLGVIKFPIGL